MQWGMICFLSCGCLFPCLGYTQDNQSQSNLWGIIMKRNNALLHGCLLAAGLTLLPFAAHATGLSNHFLAENSFTQSVKDGYQDIKKEVKETVDELTGDDKTDTQKFQERRDKDLKKYYKEVRDAQKDYVKEREKAQRQYLKHHKQLPFKEDLQKDLESAPAPTIAK